MKKNEEIILKITDLAFGGKGVAKTEERTGFVQGALPGQTVRAKVTKIKKRHFEAKISEILQPGDSEIDLSWQITPGAPWIRLPINIQKEYKKKQVFKLFKDFCELDLQNIFDDYIDSPAEFCYRNKMEYSFGITEKEGEENFSKFFGLGSRKRGSHYLVEDLKKPSGMFDEELEKFIPKIKDYCLESKFSPYGYQKDRGFFRYFAVRKSFYENRFLINLVTTSENSGKFDIQKFEDFLRKNLGERLAGFSWIIYDHFSDAFLPEAKPIFQTGEDFLTEKLNGLFFRVSLNSFFQTNTLCCEKLYSKVADYCRGENPEEILDLYCGTGTIAQTLAKQFPSVSVQGVEIHSESVELAKINSEKNGLENVSYFCGNVKDFIRKVPSSEKRLMVLDPPRAGIAPKSMKMLIELNSYFIVYISCNPATMSRDSKTLLDSGYELKKFSLVDQFPHTHHVECIGLFQKQKH